MRTLPSLAFFVAGSGLACSSAGAAPSASLIMDCPLKIQVEQRLLNPPSPWQEFHESLPLTLLGVTFYDGPPSELASLVPDREKPLGQELQATWLFPAHAPRSYFLACSYQNTTARLIQRLPQALSRCTVTYARSPSGKGLVGAPKRIECRTSP